MACPQFARCNRSMRGVKFRNVDLVAGAGAGLQAELQAELQAPFDR